MSWLSQALKGNWSSVGQSVSRSVGTLGNIAGSVATGNFVGVGANVLSLSGGTGVKPGVGYHAGGIVAAPGEKGAFSTYAQALSAAPGPSVSLQNRSVEEIVAATIAGQKLTLDAIPREAPIPAIRNQDIIGGTGSQQIKDIFDSFFNNFSKAHAASSLPNAEIALNAPKPLPSGSPAMTAASFAPIAWIVGGIAALVLILKKA